VPTEITQNTGTKPVHYTCTQLYTQIQLYYQNQWLNGHLLWEESQSTVNLQYVNHFTFYSYVTLHYIRVI